MEESEWELGCLFWSAKKVASLLSAKEYAEHAKRTASLSPSSNFIDTRRANDSRAF